MAAVFLDLGGLGQQDLPQCQHTDSISRMEGPEHPSCKLAKLLAMFMIWLMW